MPTDNAYSPGGPGPSHRPSARERGRMRRRLREQRRVREALLLDLGALVFELHRQSRREPELLQAKAAELSAVDQEVRALSRALDDGGTVQELVAAGIAGSCGSCGSLLSSDARYCSACGAPAVPALGSEGARGRDPRLEPGARHESPAGLGIAAPAEPDAGIAAPAEPDAGIAAPAEPRAGPLDRIRGRLGRRSSDG